MPLICFEPKDFSDLKLDLIAKANVIIDYFQKQGFRLTVRQLYYQFVTRDLLPQSWADDRGVLNTIGSYTKIQGLISDGRMAGLIDWNAIEDRTRQSHQNVHWNRPSKILEAAIQNYAADKWDNQDHYVEVWVEKQALEQVLETACQPLDVRFFCCRGYTSQSAMWEASERLLNKMHIGKSVHIIHLGDHDPSGVDMTDDIEKRLSLFCRSSVHVDRIALTPAQISKYNPPPNPAKTTDSRFKRYAEQHGDESWELDALDPAVLVALIKDAVLEYRNDELWEEAIKNEKRGRHTLQSIVNYFPDVVQFLRQRRKQDKSRVVCKVCGATEEHPHCTCLEKSDRPGLELT